MSVSFTKEDANNLELVRQIVLSRLKDDRHFNQLNDPWDSPSVDQFVKIESPADRNRFVFLTMEVIWQLIIQGVITPGLNPPNPGLPWFRVTDYGRKVLEAEGPIPHDPTGYLDEIRRESVTVATDTTHAYLQEALRCYTSGCHLASVLLLGVAAESVFLKLWEVIGQNLATASDIKKFQQLDRKNLIAPKHRWLADKVSNLPSAVTRQLPEGLQMTIRSLYDLIRQERNELGHPRENPPTVDREQAFMFFRLFPTFIRHVEAFAAYCQKDQI